MLDQIANLTLFKIMSVATMGSFIDLILNSRIKEKFSGYIFGKPGTVRHEHDFIIITSYVSLFCKRSKIEELSLSKILLFSFLELILFYIILLFYSYDVFYLQFIQIKNFLKVALLILPSIYLLNIIILSIFKKYFYFEVYHGFEKITQPVLCLFYISAAICAAIWVGLIFGIFMGDYGVCFFLESSIIETSEICFGQKFEQFRQADLIDDLVASIMFSSYLSMIFSSLLVAFVYISMIFAFIVKSFCKFSWISDICENGVFYNNPFFLLFFITSACLYYFAPTQLFEFIFSLDALFYFLNSIDEILKFSSIVILIVLLIVVVEFLEKKWDGRWKRFFD